MSKPGMVRCSSEEAWRKCNIFFFSNPYCSGRFFCGEMTKHIWQRKRPWSGECRLVHKDKEGRISLLLITQVIAGILNPWAVTFSGVEDPFTGVVYRTFTLYLITMAKYSREVPKINCMVGGHHVWGTVLGGLSISKAENCWPTGIWTWS